MKKLVLIDSHALIHRAFHALPPMTSPEGLATNAVYGFTTVLLKMIRELKPDYLAAAFDLAGPTFRHEEFVEYKAHRAKAPDELYNQIPLVRRLVEGFGIPVFEKEGFEADDIIGTIAEKTRREKNVQTIIMTGDLDTLQLVAGERVVVLTLKRGLSDTVTYDEKAVRERYGLTPEQLPDYKGLTGDPSDNIPGVPGIGDKTARTILEKAGTLEELYKNKAGGIKISGISEKLLAKLAENKDQAFFSKRLATIIRDVPLDFSLEKSAWRKQVDRLALDTLFHELGSASLIKRTRETLEGETPDKGPKTSPQQLPFGEVEISVQDFHETGPTAIAPVYLADESKLGEQKIQGLSFAVDGRTARYVPVPDGKIPPAVADCNPLIGHDLKPILRELVDRGRPLPRQIMDTRIAAWLLRPDAKRYEFEWVYQAVFNRPPGSDPRTRAAEEWQLHERLTESLKSANLTKLFEEIEMPLVPVLARMESRGIAVDARVLAGLAKLVTKEIAAREKKIYKLAGGEFNLNSPQQLSELLFEKLGLKGKVRKTGGGALSTAAGELDKLRDESPIIDLILEYRELQKLKTTYIEPFPALISPADGRVHTTYNQAGAGTGRLSSQDPNLQNIPTRTELGQQFRKAFTAKPGYLLVAFDYSQLELRIMAHLAQDEKMMAAFKKGEDIHTRTAVEIFRVKPDEVTKDMRRQAKALNFGIIYGMGSLGFARAAGVSRNEARGFIERYFAEFSGVAGYLEQVKKETRRLGYAETLFGRRRPLSDITSSAPMFRAQAERMAVNHPAQGTEADLIKLAMVRVDEWVQKEHLDDDVRMLLQVHDELVFEIAEKRIAEMIPKIKKIMESAHRFDVPIVVDTKEGKNWAEMEKI